MMKLKTPPTELKLRAPEPSEADIQRSIVAALRVRGWLVTRINANTTKRGERFMKSYCVFGHPPGGFPDLLALRSAPDGTTRAVLLEVKRPGAKLRPSQEGFRDFAAAHGVPCHVVRSAADAVQVVSSASSKPENNLR